MTYVVLGPVEVALAAALMLVPASLDLALKLGLTRSLWVATARATLQLGLVGLVLRQVFTLDRVWLVLPVLVAMVAMAAREAVGRTAHRVGGAGPTTFLVLLLATSLVTFTATELIVGVEPWWAPQYAIPMAGMLLGNGLTGVSLGLDRMLEALLRDRAQLEARLALGLPLWEATLPWLRQAVRSGMIPILNAMSIVGIVSLPGMMTGQILAGADPLHAVAYQLLILFMIATATALSTVGLCAVVWWHLADPLQRLRFEGITSR